MGWASKHSGFSYPLPCLPPACWPPLYPGESGSAPWPGGCARGSASAFGWALTWSAGVDYLVAAPVGHRRGWRQLSSDSGRGLCVSRGGLPQPLSTGAPLTGDQALTRLPLKFHHYHSSLTGTTRYTTHMHKCTTPCGSDQGVSGGTVGRLQDSGVLWPSDFPPLVFPSSTLILMHTTPRVTYPLYRVMFPYLGLRKHRKGNTLL